MAHHNGQQNNHPYGSLGHVLNSFNPPLTPPINNQTPPQQQQQQLVNHVNNSHVGLVLSQPTSLVSSCSSSSIGSTSSEVKIADELLYDKIEDIMCEYMRDPSRHYLHCRVLYWCLDDDLSKKFTAVVVINPPTTNIIV